MHVVTGLDAIEWTSDRDRPTNTNRGFCFLDYKNHQCAQAALKTLSNDFQYVGGLTMRIHHLA